MEVLFLLTREAAQSIEKIGGTDFLVQITCRQNASWQGKVHCLNTGKNKCFHSFLELVMLMNQCLEESSYPRCDRLFQSWENQKETCQKDRVSGPGEMV